MHAVVQSLGHAAPGTSASPLVSLYTQSPSQIFHSSFRDRDPSKIYLVFKEKENQLIVEWDWIYQYTIQHTLWYTKTYKVSMSWTFIATVTINRILRWACHVARCSDAYDSGAAAVAYWLGSTLKAEWMP